MLILDLILILWKELHEEWPKNGKCQFIAACKYVHDALSTEAHEI
jgi:hypothetical protein